MAFTLLKRVNQLSCFKTMRQMLSSQRIRKALILETLTL